jgi:mycothiol synthase
MQTETRQLEMVRFAGSPPAVPAVPQGYALRQYEERDRASYWRLFTSVFDTYCRLDDLRTAALPGAFHVAEDVASGNVVASAVAAEYLRDGHPDPGSLQWVMADSAHLGKGLGKAVVAAATADLARARYGRVYLSTDDWRLPAISMYLKLGWKPLLFAPDMEDRWKTIFEQLGREFLQDSVVVDPR